MAWSQKFRLTPGVELIETVVTRIFHAVTWKGWCLARRGWYTSKCGSCVLVRKIRSVRYRGVTSRGKGVTIPRVPHHYGAAEKSPAMTTGGAETYDIIGITYDIIGIFWRPRNHAVPSQYFSAPRVIRRTGNCAPLPLRYAPADWTIMQRVKCYRCLR